MQFWLLQLICVGFFLERERTVVLLEQEVLHKSCEGFLLGRDRTVSLQEVMSLLC